MGNFFEFRGAFSKKIAGKKVLLVDDVLTTGSALLKLKKAVERVEGNVLAGSVIVKRGELREVLNTPLYWFLETEMNEWDPRSCPLCKKGVPITEWHEVRYRKP